MTDPINAHALEIRDLEFEHRSRDGAPFVLQVPGLTVSQGEQVLLTGESGSGKSTLLQVIAGLLAPRRGEVRVDGQPLGTLNGTDLDAFRGRTIGMIFQTFNLLEGFTARENVLMALMFGGDPSPGTPSAPRNCWHTSGSTDRMPCRTSSASGSSRGWRSPGRWPPAPRWCLPTSPPPAWTPETPETPSS